MTAETDSRYAWFRLWVSLALATIGGCGMYIVVVVLPAVQAEFGAARGGASLPYMATLIAAGPTRSAAESSLVEATDALPALREGFACDIPPRYSAILQLICYLGEHPAPQ